MSIEPWNTGTDGSTGCEDMPRKSIDIRLADYPVPVEKGVVPFSCLPARTGSGRARKRVKGLLPCGFLGQRPKPSESLQESISTVFKVHLSLFFRLSFFIDYLTLPNFLLKLLFLQLRRTFSPGQKYSHTARLARFALFVISSYSSALLFLTPAAQHCESK